jgi:hypothetical protein
MFLTLHGKDPPMPGTTKTNETRSLARFMVLDVGFLAGNRYIIYFYFIVGAKLETLS